MTLFQLGEEALDERPDLSREAGPQELLEATKSMNGLAGSMIARQLQSQLTKIRLTPDELADFIDAPLPRAIPVGMRRQVLGQSLPLVFVGIVFMIAGLVAGTVWWMNATPFMKPLAFGFYLFFPGIGSLMTFGTLSSRRKKFRTLRSGTFAEGRIKKVKTSGLRVNDQQQYEVLVEYEFAGKSHESQGRGDERRPCTGTPT